jgi:hypothetical protein
MSRYVPIPADALLGELRAIGDAVAAKGGRAEQIVCGSEIVYVLAPHKGKPCAEVHVYTSLAVGDYAVRGCGQDAVRLVVGACTPTASFRPLAVARRVFRTAPKGDPEARVKAFLERLRETLREVYKEALTFPSCPACGGVMAARSSAHGPFWGCLAFPGCRATRPRGKACLEGGSCSFSTDVEADASGKTISCEKCGRFAGARLNATTAAAPGRSRRSREVQ